MTAEIVDIEMLNTMYSTNPVARFMFDAWAQRQRNRRVTTVECLLRLTKQSNAGVSRQDVIELCRQLEKAGCGAFLVGRRGHQSRFEWSVSMASVGQAAAGETSEVEGIEDVDIEERSEADEMAGESEEQDTLAHPYNLRPDFRVVVRLPFDFTPEEAERFSAFIRTLPFSS